MSKKFLTMDIETGKKQLSTAIVDDKNYLGEKTGVAYSADLVDQVIRDDVKVSEDITVTGISVGNIADGTVIPAGTNITELLKQMLLKQIPPIYNAPSAGISSSPTPTNVEAGSYVKPTVTPTFNKQHAGDLTECIIKRNGTIVSTKSNLEAFVEPENIQIADGDNKLRYECSVSYGDGPILNDNFNQPYPSGAIKAGTTNANTSYFHGKRYTFWKTDSNENVPNAEEIRGYSSKQFGTSGEITVTIPAGGKRAVIAYPANVRDITSIKYVELGNGEVKDTFTKYVVQVPGANDYTPIDYKVYVYVSAVPAAGQMTYKVTI